MIFIRHKKIDNNTSLEPTIEEIHEEQDLELYNNTNNFNRIEYCYKYIYEFAYNCFSYICTTYYITQKEKLE